MRIDNDPRPGSPRTLTNERSVKLVADALEKIVVQHMNFLEPWEQKLRRKMDKNRPQFLKDGPFILHEIGRPNIADVCVCVCLCVCVCVFQYQPTALLRASGSAQGG